MFPVKSLSVSADKLKVETEGSAAGAAPASKPSKKRKRQGNQQTVTAANLADLWEQVIEHKGPSLPGDKAQPKKANKRQKTEHASAASGDDAGKRNSTQSGGEEQQKQVVSKSEKKKKRRDKKKAQPDSQAPAAAAPAPATRSTEEEEDEWNGIDDEEKTAEESSTVNGEKEDEKEKKKKKKKKKQRKGADDNKGNAGHEQPTEQSPRGEVTAPPAPPAVKLTPLQASMREKLISARFRHLNETLYTRPSAEAFRLFEESPEMFTEYHEGFRRQVDVWPENPVDGYISDIKARAKVRSPPRERNQPVTPAQLPLPRGTNPSNSKSSNSNSNNKMCTIADLGCGDAKLAAALQPLKHKLRLDIRSFDLQTGGSPLVTRADVANLPLADGTVDVAIFCLALMGTNWIDFVEEAYRVLRWKGELWVAEIKSRFAGAGRKKGAAAVAHSVGNRKKGGAAASGGKKNKAGMDEDEEANLAELAEQVDGVVDSRKQETDISAFVEVLKKRGFLLNRDLGENAVDMSNKMFVKMHFVKAAQPTKGKCAVEGKDGQAPAKKKFIGDDEDDNEAAVLKPCVYKLR